jgi:hypothetical protein
MLISNEELANMPVTEESKKYISEYILNECENSTYFEIRLLFAGYPFREEEMGHLKIKTELKAQGIISYIKYFKSFKNQNRKPKSYENETTRKTYNT